MENIKILLNNEENFLSKVEKLKKKVDINLLNRTVKIKTINYKDWNGEIRKKTYKEVSYNVDFPEMYIIDGFEYLGGLTSSDGMITWFAKDENTTLHDKVDENIVFKCYHCNKKITTRKNRLFFKKENGDIASFGVTCAENYFGIDILRKLKKATIIWAKLGEENEEGYGGFSGLDSELEHDNAVDFCLNWFGQKNGFVSKAKEQEEDKISTASELNFYNPPYVKYKEHEMKAVHEFWDGNPYTKEQMDELKKKIYDFYENREVVTDFDRNLKNLFEMRGSKIGILVYGIFNYFKELDLLAEKKNGFVPEWFEDENIQDMKVTFKNISYFQGQFGETGIVTLHSEKNCFKWFTASCKLDFLNIF